MDVSSLYRTRAMALLIGLDEGATGSPCTQNMLRMANLLKSTFSYPDDRIIKMCDDNRGSSIPPTRRNVELALERLVTFANTRHDQAPQDATLAPPATLWIYGCFSQGLGPDGILRLQEHPDEAEPCFTRLQFWTFLRMLPSDVRVMCIIDAPSCNGLMGVESVFRYNERKTNCLNKPPTEDLLLPDVLFIFGQPLTVQSMWRGARRHIRDENDDAGYASAEDPMLSPEPTMGGASTIETQRLTGVFLYALKRTRLRLSVTTLLRKMGQTSRKNRCPFCPTLDTTRCLDSVRAFCAQTHDMPFMMVAPQGVDVPPTSEF